VSDRIRALTVLIVVFLLGCMVGAGCFLVWGSKVAAARGSRGEFSGRAPQRLVERLQLSHDQEVRFREILAGSRKQLEAVRAESAPKTAAIRADMDKKLVAILNDEQKKKFDEFRKEMESRRERMRRRPDREPSREGR
jgi:hypothetical protein